MTKQEVGTILDQLPEEFQVDDLIERLLFVKRIERGLEQVRLGQTVPHEQVMQEMRQLRQKWQQHN
jgi:predicted transcriptional regulator